MQWICCCVGVTGLMALWHCCAASLTFACCHAAENPSPFVAADPNDPQYMVSLFGEGEQSSRLAWPGMSSTATALQPTHHHKDYVPSCKHLPAVAIQMQQDSILLSTAC
jgi:hypothetical protein